MRQESKNDETVWNTALFPITNPTGLLWPFVYLESGF